MINKQTIHEKHKLFYCRVCFCENNVTSNNETVVILGGKIFRRDLNSVAIIGICTKSVLDPIGVVCRGVKQSLPRRLGWGGGGGGGGSVALHPKIR